MKIITNFFKKVFIGQYLEYKGIFQDHHIYDTINDISLNLEMNKKPKHKLYWASDRISKNKFDKLYKNNICDCEVGAGSNIVEGSKFNIKDEFEKLKRGDIECGEVNCPVDGFYYYFYKNNRLNNIRKNC